MKFNITSSALNPAGSLGAHHGYVMTSAEPRWSYLSETSAITVHMIGSLVESNTFRWQRGENYIPVRLAQQLAWGIC